MVYKDGIKNNNSGPKSNYNLSRDALYRIWFSWRDGKKGIFRSLDTIGAKKIIRSKKKGIASLRRMIRKYESQTEIYHIYDNQPPGTNVLREVGKNGVITFENWD